MTEIGKNFLEKDKKAQNLKEYTDNFESIRITLY